MDKGTIKIKGENPSGKRIELRDWTLWYAEDCKDLGNPKTEKELKTKGFENFAVEPPCTFEYELQKHGKLKDLYFGENIFDAQNYEYYHQWYSTKFKSSYKKTELVFEGIDTVAEIYVNGDLIGKTDNMFLEHKFVLEELNDCENELVVHIIPVLKAAENYNIGAGDWAFTYNYSSLPIRKSPRSYGWDIFPRLIGGGLWKKVHIEEYRENAIEESYLYTCSINEDSAKLGLFYKFRCEKDAKNHEIEIRGVCKDSVIHETHKAWHTYGSFVFEQKNPEIWWPIGEGEQNLYDITFYLKKDGKIIDEKNFKFGIRTVKLVKSVHSVPDGKFEFVVNDRKIFVNGVNWVPLDIVESKTEERMTKALDCMKDIGANIVRVWGGGYYESERFYDFCDENGILVWQDFMMGCAVYPNNSEFAERLRFEAEEVVKRLRQHASIAIWAGDNECDCACGWGGILMDPGKNILTREVLPYAIRKHDPTRDYIPSSPYVDEARDFDILPECHLWAQDIYFKEKFFKDYTCPFISEIGYYSLPSEKSLREFLANPEKLYEDNGDPSNEYLAHITSMGRGTNEKYVFRFDYLKNHSKILFSFVPDNLTDLIKTNQICQAEALKFFVERMRTQRNKMGGIIIWNLVDGYTQMSDAMLDYYFRKKQSYYYVKRSQQRLCFMFGEESEGFPLYVVNDYTEDQEVEYKVTDLRTGKVVLTGNCVAKNHYSSIVSRFTIGEIKKTFYLIEWKTKDGKIKGKNHFYAYMPDIDYAEYLEFMKKAGFEDFE